MRQADCRIAPNIGRNTVGCGNISQVVIFCYLCTLKHFVKYCYCITVFATVSYITA